MRALASDDDQVAGAAAVEVAALDGAGRERVVRRLAAELGKLPFGMPNAALALRRIAPVAVPTLLEVRERPGTRAEADLALQNMGPAASAAAPALERSLDEASPEQRVWAAGALAGVAPGRVPAAIARTAERDPAVAVGLGMALRYNPGARDAVPGLADLLRDDRPRVREFAAAALAEVGAPAGPAAPALAAAAGDRDERVKRQAERALRAIGVPPAPTGS